MSSLQFNLPLNKLAVIAILSIFTIAESATILDLDFDDSEYIISYAESIYTPNRPHLRQTPYDSTAIKLPIVINTETRYSTYLEHTIEESIVSPNTDYSPTYALGIDIKPRVDTNAPDKVELAIYDKNDNVTLRVDIEDDHPKRYIAFDIKFNWDYELPKTDRYMIHFQGLQLGAGPAFSMRVGESADGDEMDPINIEFHRQADPVDPNDPEIDEQLTGEISNLPRDKWHRFIFQLIPAYEGKINGDSPQIAVWHWNLDVGFDDGDDYKYKWTLPWGNEPTGGSTNLIQYAVGIYRRSHERVQGIKLRNIKYGNNWSDILP